jgi:hypothetical protein
MGVSKPKKRTKRRILGGKANSLRLAEFHVPKMIRQRQAKDIVARDLGLPTREERLLRRLVEHEEEKKEARRRAQERKIQADLIEGTDPCKREEACILFVLLVFLLFFFCIWWLTTLLFVFFPTHPCPLVCVQH